MKLQWPLRRSPKMLLDVGEVAALTCEIRGMAPRDDGMFVVCMSFTTHRANLHMDVDPPWARELAQTLIAAADVVETRKMQLEIEAKGGM